MIRFLKQPGLLWRLVFYALLGLSALIHPLSTIVLFSLLPLVLWWKHPDGKVMTALQPWAALALITVIFYLGGLLDLRRPVFYFDFRPGRFVLFQILGMLPFIGFLAAGVRETVVRWRRGEELAVINAGWMTAALLGQSLILQAAFAMLVGKQLQLYFAAHYPHRQLVRGMAVVHLVAAFFAGLFLMLFGFSEFGGAGFRAGMAFTSVYWIASLTGVIGLFGMGPRLVWGGTVLSGLLATFFFWTQVNPLLESRRDLPERVVAAAADLKVSGNEKLYLWEEGLQRPTRFLIYASRHFDQVESIAGRQPADRTESTAIMAMPSAAGKAFDIPADTTRIEGWNDRFKPESWLVFRNEKLK